MVCLYLFAPFNRFLVNINSSYLKRSKLFVLQDFCEKKGEVTMPCPYIEYFRAVIEMRKKIRHNNRMSENISHTFSFRNAMRLIDVWICCFCKIFAIYILPGLKLRISFYQFSLVKTGCELLLIAAFDIVGQRHCSQ
jgi:hypothetical protein